MCSCKIKTPIYTYLHLRRAVHIPGSPPSMRPGDHLFIFQIWLNLYMLTEMGLCARMLRRVVD